MNAVAKFEEKPQFQTKKEILNETKIIVDTIASYFKFFEGDMKVRILWEEPNKIRFRVNWWNESAIIKSSFVVVEKQKNEWVVKFAS